MRRPAAVALLLAWSSLSTPALAWNAAGHRLSASIAWEHLSPPARQQVAALLESHPDHGRWQGKSKHYAEAEPDFVAFVEASTWADDIRRDPRFEDGEQTTATLTGYPDASRHRDWHYENLPLETRHGQRHLPTQGQLSSRIQLLTRQLGDPRRRPEERAYALVWLIHLVGDIHQPLHVVSHLDAAGRPDGGGNDQPVSDPLNPRRSYTNLHAYWDDLPGPSWLRGKRLQEAALRLQEDTPAHRVRQGAPLAWREESRSLARSDVYPETEGEAIPTLDAVYQEKAQGIARRRIAEAGYRLARLLNKSLGK